MPIGTYDHPLFGEVEFKTVDADWTYGGKIVFTKGFSTDAIKWMLIPQLVKVPGSNKGKLQFHERGQNQLMMVFADIERLGLMGTIKTCAGSLNLRLRKPIPKKLSKKPSNHAFGIAIDLNSDDGSNGASVAPVSHIFEQHGFVWGKAFNDPMHFELASFIDAPVPVAIPAAVLDAAGNVLSLGAMEYQGMIGVDLAKVKAVLKLVEHGRKSSMVEISKGAAGTRQRIAFRAVGGVDYVQLSAVAGVLGLPMHWNVATKIARLG